MGYMKLVSIKSRANILTRVQSKDYKEPSSFNSLFNLPYSKDIHYFSQARHIAHSTTQCRKLYLYTLHNYRIFPCVFEEHWSLELHKCQRSSLKQILDSVNIIECLKIALESQQHFC